MKNKTKCWILLQVLCLSSALLLLTACNSEKKENTQYIQTYTVSGSAELPESVTDVSKLSVSGDTAYLCCFEGRDDSYLEKMNISGGNFQKSPLSISPLDFVLTPDNNIWIVSKEPSWSLTKLSSDGGVCKSIDISRALELHNSDSIEISMGLDSDENICVAINDAGTYVYVVNSEGELLFDLKSKGNLLGTLTTAQGNIGVCSTMSDIMSYRLTTIDVAKKDWSEDTVELGSISGIYGERSGGFYYSDTESLYAYDSEKGESSVVLN